MGPEIVIPLGAFATAIICAIGIPLARGYTRRMDAEARNPRAEHEAHDCEGIGRLVDERRDEYAQAGPGRAATHPVVRHHGAGQRDAPHQRVDGQSERRRTPGQEPCPLRTTRGRSDPPMMVGRIAIMTD